MRGKRPAPKPLTYTPGIWLGARDFGGGEEGALVNDATAQWLAGDPANNMLIWAESHGALPHHWIDPETGRLWSIEKNPGVNAYSKTATFDYRSDSPIKMDPAHYPSICYVPYLATEDPYYLEELQFAANYHTLVINPAYRMDAAKKVDLGIFNRHQMRAYVWHLRDTAMAYLATPHGEVPAPLLPKSYWKRILDNNRDFFIREWINKTHALSRLHMVPIINKGNVAPWQQDWLGVVVGWMIWTGQFDDWKPIYEWTIRQAIDRTSGKSGYPRSRAIQYWPRVAKDMKSFAAANDLTETPDGKFPPKTNMHYAGSLRANLKIAVLNRIPEAAECFAYVDPQVTYIVPRWAV